MVRTRVGYSGGAEPSPDYHDLKDHCETTQIQFDPCVVTYAQLLKIFWERHDYATPIKEQYKSAIFYNSQEQRQEAAKSVQFVKDGVLGQQRLRGKEIRTVVQPATTFYIAELYHQKYFLQCNRKLFGLLQYRAREDLIDDPVATSLNGYLHGSGSAGALMAEVDTWPLPFAVKFAVLHHVTGGEGLAAFKPIVEADVENPLPGPFVEHGENAILDSVAASVRNDKPSSRRSFEDIESDFIDIFPKKKAKC